MKRGECSIAFIMLKEGHNESNFTALPYTPSTMNMRRGINEESPFAVLAKYFTHRGQIQDNTELIGT